MRLAAVAVLVALLLTGCGSDSQDARSPLDDALGYVPRDAPAVLVLETGGPQADATGELLERMPVVGGQLYNWVTQTFGWALIRFERDIRPLLGHELVVGVTDPRGALAGRGVLGRLPSVIVAWRVTRPDQAKRVIVRSPDLQAHRRVHGARLWEARRGQAWFAVDGDVLLATGSERQLVRALERRRSGERLTEAQLDDALDGLPEDALVRMRLDPHGLLESFPRLRGVLAQRWIAAVRESGATIAARDDGFALAVRARTDPEQVADADLPLAPRGPTPATLRRGAETGVGISEPGRLTRFAEQVMRAVEPGRYAVLDRLRRRLQQRVGVDVQRDLLARIAQASIALSADATDVAGRAQVVEARQFRSALERLIPALPGLGEAFGIRDLGVSSPAPGQRFFAAAVPGHQSVVFGLVGNSLVASDDTRRAGELVVEPSRFVEGARGAAVVSGDAGALAERLGRDRVRGVARLGLPVALRPLGDLNGWLRISRAGLRGQAHVAVAD